MVKDPAGECNARLSAGWPVAGRRASETRVRPLR